MNIVGHAVPDTINLKHWLSLRDTKVAQRLLITNIFSLAGNIEKEADAMLLEASDAGIQLSGVLV